MARFTIKAFAEAIGLGTSRDGVVHAGIVLKTMNNRGLAPVVGKIHPPTGRPALVYDLDQKVARAIGVKSSQKRPPKPQKNEYDVWQVMRMMNEIRESMGLRHMNYDHFTRRLSSLRDNHKGSNNPYQAIRRKGCTRVFSPRSAFLISRKIAPMQFNLHEDARSWAEVA